MADKFPLTDEQVLAFYKGDELVAEDAHDALYAYYTNPALGDDAMPYGTAKARSGDPYQWIANKVNARAREIITREVKDKVTVASLNVLGFNGLSDSDRAYMDAILGEPK